MATEKTTSAPKAKPAPVAVAVRVQDQLARAVLAKKITKEELEQIKSKVEKLAAFLDA